MKKLIKYGVLWLVISIAAIGLCFLLNLEVDRETPPLLACLCGVSFGTVTTFFIYMKKHLVILENKFVTAIGSRFAGLALCFFAICICSTTIGVLLFKLTSVIGDAFISFRTLILLSAMLGTGGTVCLYVVRAVSNMKLFDVYEESNDGVYIGPVRGDVLLFLVPAASKDEKNAPSLVLSPMSLWDNLKRSETEPDIGMPHAYALLNACRGVKAFERVFNNQERLSCAMRAGGWIGAMEPGASKDTILKIYQKCCSLNDDEIVSLTVEELSFIEENSKHEESRQEDNTL